VTRQFVVVGKECCPRCGADLWRAAYPLTPRQLKVLEVLRTHTEANGYPPTLKEMAVTLNVRSLGTVCELLGILEKKGYVRRAGLAAERATHIVK
jgi:SOS-response transcriptional repressor LexA